jgi:ACS family glucarate transporter-like MFS transporter
MPLLRQPVRIRWWIFTFLFVFATLSYLQRQSFSIVAGPMMADLHFNKAQFGWLATMFAVAYTLSQIPSAALGQRFGARATYVAVGLLGLTAMLLAPVAPMISVGLGLFVLLLLAQGALGVSQGPVFPMFAAVVQTWFPERRWGFANGLQTAGMDLGGLMAPPLIGFLMHAFGWKGALLWLALPAVVLTIWWGGYARNTPEEHRSVTPAEIAELAGTDRTPAPPLTMRRLLGITTNRDVLLLSVSYLCMNFTFYLLSVWSYIYLTEVRHLEGLGGDFAAAIPWLGAATGAAVGGHVSDWFVLRFGARWGDRLVPLVTLPLAGVLLIVTTYVTTLGGAVAALTLAFCLIEFNEGPYWAATMRVARADTGAATGVLNTGGNLGGVLSNPIVGHLSNAGSWNGAFFVGTALAVVAAGLWLLIDTDRRVVAAS